MVIATRVSEPHASEPLWYDGGWHEHSPIGWISEGLRWLLFHLDFSMKTFSLQ